MGMKVWIDQDLCTGDGLCEEIAPDVFTLLDDGLAYVKEGAKVFSDPGGPEGLANVPAGQEEADRSSPPRSAPASASSSRSSSRHPSAVHRHDPPRRGRCAVGAPHAAHGADGDRPAAPTAHQVAHLVHGDGVRRRRTGRARWRTPRRPPAPGDRSAGRPSRPAAARAPSTEQVALPTRGRRCRDRRRRCAGSPGRAPPSAARRRGTRGRRRRRPPGVGQRQGRGGEARRRRQREVVAGSNATTWPAYARAVGRLDPRPLTAGHDVGVRDDQPGRDHPAGPRLHPVARRADHLHRRRLGRARAAAPTTGDSAGGGPTSGAGGGPRTPGAARRRRASAPGCRTRPAGSRATRSIARATCDDRACRAGQPGTSAMVGRTTHRASEDPDEPAAAPRAASVGPGCRWHEPVQPARRPGARSPGRPWPSEEDAGTDQEAARRRLGRRPVSRIARQQPRGSSDRRR